MRKKIRESFELSEFVTKADQQLWKIILNNALPRLFTQREHRLSLKKCLDLWSRDGEPKTLGQLKDSLARLGLTLSYELTDETGKVEEGSFPLLANVQGDSEKIHYSYADAFLNNIITRRRLTAFLDNCGLLCGQITPPSDSKNSPKFIPSCLATPRFC